MGFLLAIQDLRTPQAGLLPIQSRLHPPFPKLLARTMDGRETHIQRFADPGVRPVRPSCGSVCFKENARPQESACRRRANSREVDQLTAFFFSQRDHILYRQGRSPWKTVDTFLAFSKNTLALSTYQNKCGGVLVHVQFFNVVYNSSLYSC